jgi:hypothetical protein
VEFYLWAEFAPFWQIDELMILLRIMPVLQRLLLNVATSDARLLDGEQIRSLLSAVNILHLESLNYAVEYCGASLEQSTILNLQQKWLPQSIAFIFDTEYANIFLYTIPFKFHRFWSRIFSLKAKKFSEEQKLPMCYGEGAYIDHCCSSVPEDRSNLYTVMQKSSHVEKLLLLLPCGVQTNSFGR